MSEPIFAHGTVVWPKSRIKSCHDNPSANNCKPCGSSIYEWRSILQPDTNYGKHRNYVPNGQLASGGNPDKYGCLDALISWPTQNDWKKTIVNYGDIFVKWYNTAPHTTQYYKVYITPLDWDPSKPLNWDDLIEIGHKGKGPAEEYTTIKATIPDSYIGKRAALFSVWQRDYSHSHEAFYSVSDILVKPGGASSDDDPVVDDDDTGNTNNCNDTSLWNNQSEYSKDTFVQHANNIYKAKWWTKNQNPANNSGQWQVWESIGQCPASSNNTTQNKSFSILSASPNPSDEISSVNYEVTQFTGNLSMTIRTLNNRIVYKIFSNKNKSIGKHKQSINIKSLIPGIYLCVIEDKNGLISTKKILVK